MEGSKKLVPQIGSGIDFFKDIKNPEVRTQIVQNLIYDTIKKPAVKINRAEYLRNALQGRFSEKEIDAAIKHNPAFAGIPREQIDVIAKHAIAYEGRKVTAFSVITGLTDDAAALTDDKKVQFTLTAGSFGANTVQYFVFIFRIIQKLRYLYGFEEIDLTENTLSDETMNLILSSLGIMFAVSGTNGAVSIVSGNATKKLSKTLSRKALTKGLIYPAVKKITAKAGIALNKEKYAKAVAMSIDVAFDAISGGISFASFKMSAKRLQKHLRELNLSDPEYYKNKENFILVADADTVTAPDKRYNDFDADEIIYEDYDEAITDYEEEPDYTDVDDTDSF